MQTRESRLFLILLRAAFALMLMPFMAPAASASAAKVTPMATAGFYHSLVLRDDGTVWAWGRNDSGQLGDGTTADKTTPVRVKVKDYDGTLVPLSGVAALAGGSLHSLALDMDGTVWAWGSNQNGQLGARTSIDFSPTPVRVKWDLLNSRRHAGQ